MKITTLLLAIPLLGLALPNRATAEDDARIKETLRTLTLRLRTAETDKNNLLSEKAQLEQDKKELTTKVASLTKQATTDKADLDALNAKSAEQEKKLTETTDALSNWKTNYEQLRLSAQKSEGERAKLSDEAIVLKRKVADREEKNRQLFKLANEILTRYEKFGLGEALAAKEPFTGITRVKLETLVQDYSDKIADQRAKP